METAIINQKNQLQTIAKTIAFDIPELKELNEEQIKKIAELVIIERYKEELNKEVDLVKFDYSKMKDDFLKTCKSENTKQTYSNAFSKFEKYSDSVSINKLSFTFENADNFIFWLISEGFSNSTIRITVRTMSAFFNFVERRTNGKIKNSFKGSKATPKQTTKNKNKFYNNEISLKTLETLKDDFQKIIDNVENKELKAIIKISISCGLRVGAFENLSIHSNKYKTISKGVEISGYIPEETLKYIDSLGIKHNTPFERYTDTRLKNLFKYHTNKLYKSGVIKTNYSFHDLRHYFALNDYLINKDIYRLSKLLNHSSIEITAKYLKGVEIRND